MEIKAKKFSSLLPSDEVALVVADKFTLDEKGQPKRAKKAKAIFMTLSAALQVIESGGIDNRKTELLGYVDRKHKSGSGAKSTFKLGRIVDDSEDLDDDLFSSQDEVNQFNADSEREQLEKERADFEREKAEFFENQKSNVHTSTEEDENEENEGDNQESGAPIVNLPAPPPAPAPAAPAPVAPAKPTAPKAPAKPAAPKQ